MSRERGFSVLGSTRVILLKCRFSNIRYRVLLVKATAALPVIDECVRETEFYCNSGVATYWP